MGIKRVVDTDFWTDEKVMEMFTPEDKLFFLYLLTNPHCTPLGIYKIIPKQIAFELGYSIESVMSLIDRFQNTYHIIRYSDITREIAIKNYLRYGIVSGGKPIKDRLTADVNAVKDKTLLTFVSRSMEGHEPCNQTVREVLQWMKKIAEPKELGDGDGSGDGFGDGDGVSYHDSYHESYHDSSNTSISPSWKDDPDLPSKIIPVISDWLEYKKERREAYKAVGLKSLITQIKNNIQKYGADRVIEVIISSMGSGYKGICFEKLQNQKPGAAQKPEPEKFDGSHIGVWF